MEGILSEEILLFHGVAMLWSILFHVSPTLWRSIIYKFFANIFWTIFIAFAILNIFMYLYAPNSEERLTWLVLIIFLTGPSAITSFTLLLLLSDTSMKHSETQTPQIVYAPQFTSEQIQWNTMESNKMMI